MKNKRLVKGIFGVVGALILSVVIYQYAYAKTYDTPLFSTSSETGVIGKMLNKVTNQPAVQAETVAKFDTQGMTLETLASYDGKDGQPAYVAFEGIVYDLSALADWRSGEHHGVTAGKDITEVFSQSPHSNSILKLAVVVGKVVTEETLVNDSALQPENNQVNTSSMQPENTTSTIQINPSKLGTVTTTSKIWTYDLLAQYNGKNGQPAYIAVDGVIYDVTALGSWSTGTHHGVTAGKDVTADFASSPHASSILKKAIIVGKINEVVAGSEVATTQTTSNGTNSTTSTTTTSTNTTAGATSTGTTASNSSTKATVWTYDLLAKYNGKNGQPAYIAVDGIIYDVTALGSWSTGTHHGVTAGKDVTADFAASPHSKSILQQAVIIGRIDYPVEQGSSVTTPVVQASDDDDYDDNDNEDDDDKDDNDDDEDDRDDDDDDSNEDDRDND